MPTHVALLRGVNVGGGGKIVMADLRALVTSLGYADVTTYIQTGNLVFTATESDGAALAAALHAAIAEALGVRTPVVVLARAALAQVVSDNPYPDEPNPRFLHGVFLPDAPAPQALAAVREASRRAAEQGSRDEAVLLGRTLYLHTPDGFGRSVLASDLLLKRSSPVSAGTARNWATVMKLLALCDG
ncbi:MAG TPA: DUF1697 domain-containing protein [Streptosporangiaceae bacterium]|nr:DUF1697 domain-containing protein [Streptosporangiaceae bacterium]